MWGGAEVWRVGLEPAAGRPCGPPMPEAGAPEPSPGPDG